MIYFFQKADGTVFACEDREAYAISKNTNERNPPKQIGSSHGEVFSERMKEADAEILKLKAQKARLEELLDKIQDELLLSTGAKAKALEKKEATGLKNLEKFQTQIQKIQSEAHTKAFEAELEVARGKISPVLDMSINRGTATPKILEVLKV